MTSPHARLSLSSKKGLQLLISLLLASFACPVHTIPQLQQSAMSRKHHASFDGHTSTKMERVALSVLRVLQADRSDRSFTHCVANYLTRGLESQQISPSRLEVIRKICRWKLDSNLEQVSKTILKSGFNPTKPKERMPHVRQSRQQRSINDLLRRAKKATLQYIYSRLRKAIYERAPDFPDIFPGISPGLSPGFGQTYDSCRSFFNSPTSDFNGSKDQKNLLKEMLKRFREGDANTKREICRQLKAFIGIGNTLPSIQMP